MKYQSVNAPGFLVFFMMFGVFVMFRVHVWDSKLQSKMLLRGLVFPQNVSRKLIFSFHCTGILFLTLQIALSNFQVFTGIFLVAQDVAF